MVRNGVVTTTVAPDKYNHLYYAEWYGMAAVFISEGTYANITEFNMLVFLSNIYVLLHMVL